MLEILLGIIGLLTLKSPYYSMGAWLFIFMLGSYISINFFDKFISIMGRGKINWVIILAIYIMLGVALQYIPSLTIWTFDDSKIRWIIITLALLALLKKPVVKIEIPSFFICCSQLFFVQFIMKRLLYFSYLQGKTIAIVIIVSCVNILVLCLFAIILKRFLPKLYNVVSGSR